MTGSSLRAGTRAMTDTLSEFAEDVRKYAEAGPSILPAL